MISSSKDLYLSQLQSPLCHEGNIAIGSRDYSAMVLGERALFYLPHLLCGASSSIQKALLCLTPHSCLGILVQQTLISLQLQTPLLLVYVAEGRVVVISVVMTTQ